MDTIEETDLNTVSIIKVAMNSHDYYGSALADLANQYVKHLGWLNSGVELPKDCHWEKFYSNRSGSSCLYVDRIKRLAYSVDMGD